MASPIEVVERVPTPDEVNALRRANGYAPHRPEHLAAAWRGSLFSLCAVTADGAVVGIGRVVGDGALWNYVQDVIVLPDHQGAGVGGRLMAGLLGFLERTAAPGSDVALISTPAAVEFYRRLGFAECRTDVPAMRRKVGPSPSATAPADR